jgi:hypothetical protein
MAEGALAEWIEMPGVLLAVRLTSEGYLLESAPDNAEIDLSTIDAMISFLQTATGSSEVRRAGHKGGFIMVFPITKGEYIGVFCRPEADPMALHRLADRIRVREGRPSEKPSKPPLLAPSLGLIALVALTGVFLIFYTNQFAHYQRVARLHGLLGFLLLIPFYLLLQRHRRRKREEGLFTPSPDHSI